MATITDRNVFAGRHLAAAGPVRQARGGRWSDSVVRWSQTRRGAAAEIDAAYEEAKQMRDADRRLADERAALVEAFVAARGEWTAELRILAKARRFDDAHPSRDPLYDELHAEQLLGTQYSEVA